MELTGDWAARLVSLLGETAVWAVFTLWLVGIGYLLYRSLEW